MTFILLDKKRFPFYSHRLFYILHSNMSVITPTGNDYNQDYSLWLNGISDALKLDNRNIILICNNDESVVGYFQYYIDQDLLMMEEIQILTAYQGKNLFRGLYGYIFSIIPKDIKYVAANVHKKNKKSQSILEYLGLVPVGENKNGNSYRYKGTYEDLLKWFNCT